VLYAGDILLIAPSVCEVNKLLQSVERELIELDMAINANKSCSVRVGPRFDVIVGP